MSRGKGLDLVPGIPGGSAVAGSVSRESAVWPHSKQSEDDGFEPFQPFSQKYGPDLPASVFKGTLRDMVDCLARAQQLPGAAIATWMLGVLATCVARKFEASPRKGWREPLNVFAIAALPPANRKSPALRALTKPLAEYERRYNEKNREAREEGEQRIRLLERRLEKLEREHLNSAEDDAAGSHAAAVAARRALCEAKGSVMRELTCFTSDVTPEAAADLMARNGERLACVSAEGDEFFALMRRYASDGMANQDFYLKAHAGDRHRVHRKGRPGVDLEAPALSLVLAVQPSVIDDIRTNRDLRRRGMIARLLLVVPESWLGDREIAPEPVPDQVSARYRQVVQRMLDQAGESSPLAFNKAANELLEKFESDIEPRLGQGGDLNLLSDWAGKLAGLIVRFSGILHCAEAAERNEDPRIRDIDFETVQRAIALGEWALDHALVVLGEERENDELAIRLWRWISRRAVPSSSFSARDAFNGTRGKSGQMGATNASLAELVARGYLRCLPQPGKRERGGRPKSPIYAVNSDALTR